MDPIDLVDFLQLITQLFRAGAEYVIGSVIGVAFGGTAGWWAVRWSRRWSQAQIESLRAELNGERKARTAVVELLEKAQGEVANLREKLTGTIRELEDTRRQKSELEDRLRALQSQLSHLEAERDNKNSQIAELQRRLTDAEQRFAEEQACFKAELAELRHELEVCRQQLQEEKAKLEAELEESRTLRDRREKELLAELELVRSEKAELASKVDDLQRQIERAYEGTKELWYQPPRDRVPPFLPLHTRDCPIIALVNLKGGVGKTTITAYLGVALAEKGKRVLLVDLDYQSSLTHLCLSPERRPWSQGISPEDVQNWIWVGRFLLDPEKNLEVALHRALRADTSPDEPLWIWPAHEYLYDVETRLQIELLVPTKTEDGIDQRHRLRRVLHQEELGRWFDIVLLDCPPRPTAGCVNALFAADYFLIPVRPDPTSADAVPRLLQWVKKFQPLRSDFPLKLLGIVFNELTPRSTSPGGVIRDHAEMIYDIMLRAGEHWPEEVYEFPARIGFNNDIARAARAGGVRWNKLHNSGFWNRFQDLASQLLQRLNNLEEKPHDGGGDSGATDHN